MVRMMGLILFFIWFLSQGDLDLEGDFFGENSNSTTTTTLELLAGPGRGVAPLPSIEELLDEFATTT